MDLCRTLPDANATPWAREFIRHWRLSVVRASYASWYSVLCVATLNTAWAQPPVPPEVSPEQLHQWLQQYPEADANQDGVLTRQEAETYRRQLAQRQKKPARGPQDDFRTEFTFAPMSDGVQIALAVAYPRGLERDAVEPSWPAMFEMMGYPDSTVPRSPRDFGNRYVTVRASVRGAGASGGAIQALSQQTARDGYEIIENWIVTQPWSNGKVALHGHSWGGLTGLMVAATNPPHLTAVAVSGLFDDIYRDIGRIGGIRNCGFPVDWMVNLYKPTGPFDSGEAALQSRGMTRAEYEAIVAGRPRWDLPGSLLWHALHSEEDIEAFAAASPGAFASGVRAPIHLMHAYQDEQTGPAGAWIWHSIPDDVPKRLVLSNGNHADVRRFHRERLRWLDYWTLREDAEAGAEFTDRARRVQIYFETPADSDRVNQPLVAADFPLPETQWTRYYLHENRQLLPDPPSSPAQAGDSFRVSVDQGDQMDGVYYLLDCGQSTAICGPLCVSLWVNCTTIDTDLFVALVDVAPDGIVQMLQRGLLRASHRKLDPNKSLWLVQDGESVLVRPRHTHRAPQPVVPGEPFLMEIEVCPVGHVFHAGHQLGLWISQPPQNDPVTRHGDGRPAYKYESGMPPGQVTILRDQGHASSILVPRLPRLPPLGREPLKPGAQSGIFVRPAPEASGAE
jgi:hypothetical protein